jgi:hypothetical protein
MKYEWPFMVKPAANPPPEFLPGASAEAPAHECALCDAGVNMVHQIPVVSINGVPQPRGSAYTFMGAETLNKIFTAFRRGRSDTCLTPLVEHERGATGSYQVRL